MLKSARVNGKALVYHGKAKCRSQAKQTPPTGTPHCRLRSHDGTFELSVPGLHVAASQISKSGACTAAHRVLGCRAQGRENHPHRSGQVYKYDSSQMIVFSVALPLTEITRASHAAPYLSVKLDSIRANCRPRLESVSARSACRPGKTRSYLALLSTHRQRGAAPVMDCLAQPRDIELLAPLSSTKFSFAYLRSTIVPESLRWASPNPASNASQKHFLVARQFLSTHEDRRTR